MSTGAAAAAASSSPPLRPQRSLPAAPLPFDAVASSPAPPLKVHIGSRLPSPPPAHSPGSAASVRTGASRSPHGGSGGKSRIPALVSRTDDDVLPLKEQDWSLRTRTRAFPRATSP
jgi:hypothetical protein